MSGYLKATSSAALGAKLLRVEIRELRPSPR